MSITVEVAVCLEIARALHTSAGDVNIIDRDVTAATLAAQNVVIPAFFRSGASDVSDCDVLDYNTIGRVASGTAIEVVLLNVDTIDGDISDIYVFEEYVGDETSCVGVRLDSRSVFGI